MTEHISSYPTHTFWKFLHVLEKDCCDFRSKTLFPVMMPNKRLPLAKWWRCKGIGVFFKAKAIAVGGKMCRQSNVYLAYI